MLPIIPIIAAVASASILIKRNIKGIGKKVNFSELTDYIKSKHIPVDINGNFDPNTVLGATPLLFLVITKPQLLESLLEYGANPNVYTNQGIPALNYALKYIKRSDEIVAKLLKHGADPNIMDSNGSPALFYAQSAAQVKLLQEAGADLNAVDNNGIPVLFHSIMIRNFGITKVLIERGADANARDNDGKTAAFFLAGIENSRIVKLLEDNGMDIHAMDNSGKKFPFYESYIQQTRNQDLQDAIFKNNLKGVRSALKNGANPNTEYQPRGECGWRNMINKAIWNNNPTMIEVLVKAGADINDTILDNGLCPLGNAIRTRKVECVKKLLELGADMNLYDAREAINRCDNNEINRLIEKTKLRRGEWITEKIKTSSEMELENEINELIEEMKLRRGG